MSRRPFKSFNCDPRLSCAVGFRVQALKAGGFRKASESMLIEAAIVALLTEIDPHNAYLVAYREDGEDERVRIVMKLAGVWP